MLNMEPPMEIKEAEAQAQEESARPTRVWKSAPRMWERCTFCELKRECTTAGVSRGSKACTDARYAMARR